LNLIYFHFNFFRHLIKTQASQLDKGESIFPRDHYNYVKTKDMKYMSIGNLEPKFQENTKKILESISKNKNTNADYISNLVYEVYEEKNSNISNNSNNSNNIHELHTIQRIFENYDRDELFVKVREIY
jgi:hypothetical protein